MSVLLILFVTGCSPAEQPDPTPSPIIPHRDTPAPTVAPPTAEPTTLPPPTPVPHAATQLQRLSRASDGTASNGDSHSADLSADGRWVVFTSEADNLIPQDSNQVSDIFLHDRQTGETTRLSVASDGTQSNGDSFSPVISADGQVVIFTSQADNLIVGDTNSVSDIFLHRRDSSITRRISLGGDGTQANDRSFGAHISADGRTVAFTSQADNFTFGDTNGVADAFVYDAATQQVNKVSLTPTGEQARQNSRVVDISADGQRVLFTTSGALTDPTSAVGGLFLYDQTTGQTEQLVEDDSGLGIVAASLSGDGQTVAYQQFVGRWTIFLLDIESGNRQDLRLGNQTQPPNFDLFSPALSFDGRRLAFSSPSSTLNANDTNGLEDVFLFDIATQQLQWLSQTADGIPADGASEFPAISADGQTVLFTSVATNLLPDDTNQARDLFARHIDPEIPTSPPPPPRPFDLDRLTRTTVEVGFPLLDVAISPDSQRVAVSGYGGAGMYNLPDVSRQLFWLSQRVDRVSWSPEGQRLVGTELDGSVPVWATTTGGRLSLLGFRLREPEVWQPRAAWSPQGTYIASNTTFEEVYLWDVISATAEIVLNDDGADGVNGLAWSPDGADLVISDSAGVRLWNLRSRESRLILPTAPRYRINDVAWSVAGDYLASGGQTVADERGLVHLWQPTGRFVTLTGPPNGVNSVAWSPDGWLVSAGADGVWLWDVPTASPTILDGLGEVTAVDWSADGRYLVAGTAAGVVHVWTR